MSIKKVFIDMFWVYVDTINILKRHVDIHDLYRHGMDIT